MEPDEFSNQAKAVNCVVGLLGRVMGFTHHDAVGDMSTSPGSFPDEALVAFPPTTRTRMVCVDVVVSQAGLTPNRPSSQRSRALRRAARNWKKGPFEL
jgi:hypothetical protein